jgi:EAL domain-containing protein (putative c-di-GMP-specific phosphodiesterase class I)
MVEISTRQMGKKLVFANLGPREVFGELALISQQPRTATALALEETEVLIITRKHLQELIDSADPLLTNLLQGYLGRFMWTQRFMLNNSSGHLHAGGESLQKQADRELALEKEIDQAIQNRNFELFYQPVVCLRSGRIAGFEALMRWRHPSRGLVSPLEFIGLAEKTGQIVDMGYWALEKALGDLRKFQAASDRAGIGETGDGESQSNNELFMSVNVSGRQLLELEEIERLGQLLANSGVAPERVKLEITESLLVDDPAHAAVALGKLREKGVRLAIDDFGTGYSSLSYLHMFPLDTLKIDHSFVSNMLKDERRFRIVRAISRLARDLDLEVIAEGIETPQELQKLRELECDYIQGFLFARPIPSAEIETLLASHPFYS